MAEEFDNLPEELSRDLKEVHGDGPSIPGELDQEILNRARAKLISRRRRTIIWRIGSLAAAAAVVLFAVQLSLHLHSPVHPTSVARLPEDLNGDGRVDIVDAFYLARAVQSSSTRPQWDFNHDGAVDRRDADTVAASAVSLNGASQ